MIPGKYHSRPPSRARSWCCAPKALAFPPHVLPSCDQQAFPTVGLVRTWILRFSCYLGACAPKNSSSRNSQRSSTFTVRSYGTGTSRYAVCGVYVGYRSMVGIACAQPVLWRVGTRWLSRLHVCNTLVVVPCTLSKRSMRFSWLCAHSSVTMQPPRFVVVPVGTVDTA